MRSSRYCPSGRASRRSSSTKPPRAAGSWVRCTVFRSRTKIWWRRKESAQHTDHRFSATMCPTTIRCWWSASGPTARNVEDVALLLSAMAGPDSRSPLSIHEPGSRFAKPLDRAFRSVRVAWCPNFAGVPFEKPVREVFQARRKTFEAIGCTVEEADPDFSDADEIFRVFRALGFYQQHGGLLPKYRDQIKDTV